ncbi:abi family protein (plasmid) [Mesorhizobium sp. WSM1497]|nr:abi family protein [Mesorhizobium sp. WSM1497]
MTIPQRRTLLESRDMAVPDVPKAEEYLQQIGYYRLSAYWYPFRKLVQQQDNSFALGNAFKAGTQFKHSTDLYAFDKGLRLLVLDAIERIEISVRTEVALSIGRHDPRAQCEPALLDKRFTTAKNPAFVDSMHTGWLRKLDKRAATSKEEFAVHFRTKNPGETMPVWIAVELLDFGPLSPFLSGMRYSDVQAISASYGGLRPLLIKSWTRSLSGIRNVCAHHSRHWNKPLVDQPALPNHGEIPDLDHLSQMAGANRRLYAALAIMRLLLKQINPRTNWADRLKTHMAQFPTAPNIKIGHAGFPANWAALPLWN